jgi:hypothetical protein
MVVRTQKADPHQKQRFLGGCFATWFSMLYRIDPKINPLLLRLGTYHALCCRCVVMGLAMWPFVTLEKKRILAGW